MRGHTSIIVELFLHEELTLMALKPDTGTLADFTTYPYGAAGAILTELFLHERIVVDGQGRKKRVAIASSEPTGEPILDECLERILHSKRTQNGKTWVNRFARIKGLNHRISQQLCEYGIVSEESVSVLGIFQRTVYPEQDPKPRHMLKDHLRQALLSDAEDVDTRTVALLVLLHSLSLLKDVFTKNEIKERKARLKVLCREHVGGKAVHEAIEEMQAGVAVAGFMPGMSGR